MKCYWCEAWILPEENVTEVRYAGTYWETLTMHEECYPLWAEVEYAVPEPWELDEQEV